MRPTLLLFLVVALFTSKNGAFDAKTTNNVETNPNQLRDVLQLDEEEYHDKEFRRHKVKNGFSYYVSIRHSLHETHRCAGALIAPDWVLTSAWCMDREFHGKKVVNASVHIGSYAIDITKNELRTEDELKPEEIEIKSVRLHEKYSNGSRGNVPYDVRYDIAFIQLKNSSEHKIVGLPIGGIVDCCEDMELWSVGFGRSRPSGPYALNREASRYPFLPYEECYAHFKKKGKNEYFTKGKNMSEDYSICVSNPNEECFLDIGAPLISKGTNSSLDMLIGFATRATGECSSGDPYNLAFINGHLDWIFGFEDLINNITLATATNRLSKRGGAVSQRTAASSLVVIEAFPYVVSITTKASQAHECGGVLITPLHILTTATCVLKLDKLTLSTKFTVKLGSTKVVLSDTANGESIELDTTRVIRRWSRGRHINDLVIIKLRKKSKFQPIRLPSSTLNCCNSNLTFLLAGYGASDSDSRFSEHLLASKFNLFPSGNCKTREVPTNPANLLCAGNEVDQGSLCSGDEGHGLVLPSTNGDILIGIATSAADQHCGTMTGQFYNVTRYMKWITRIVSKE